MDGWLAKPMAPAARERKFREVRSLAADRALLSQATVAAGCWLGGIGLTALTASAIGWIVIMPLKTVEYRLLSVDQTTGIIGVPVGLQDAPRLFGDAVDQQFLRRYIETREGYVPELDEQNDHATKILSSPEEQARIADARQAPEHPAKKLGKDGHVQVDNFRFHKLANGKGLTRSYLVQFEATVWSGATRDARVPFSATIDFQWHPELPMLPADRSINPGGMQVIAYSAHPDTPDVRKK